MTLILPGVLDPALLASFIGCSLPLLCVATFLLSKTSVLLQLSDSSPLSWLPPRHNPAWHPASLARPGACSHTLPDFFPWYQPPSLQMILRVSPDLSSELGNQISNRFHGKTLAVAWASSLILCKKLIFSSSASLWPQPGWGQLLISSLGEVHQAVSPSILPLLPLTPELRLLSQAHTYHPGIHEPHREPCLRPCRE